MYKDYPLTKQQLGLWIEQKLHPNNTSYNTCVKVRLTGKLDEQRFLKATQEVINFFDTLKVYFVEKNGVPFQRIDENVEYLPELIDLSDGYAEESKEKSLQAKKILSDKLNTAIDLTQFPIMRASLIKTAKEVYYFIGMVPHIVSDGRSAILYLESLSVAYNEGKKGLQETFGNTKKNWDNFQADGHDQVDSQQHQLSKKHWQERLNNANHYFDYSYGKKMIDVDDKRGERVYFNLSEIVSSKLKAHCKSNRTTLFNVLVCAFSIFIYKYYRLNDVLIGYPINIRPTGYKHFFGFFVNILPIRIDMRGDPSYETLLKNIHQIRRKDKKHQEYPALDLVSDIRDKLPDFDGRVFNLSMAQTVSRLFDLKLNGVNSEPLDSEYYDVNDDFSLSYEIFEQRIGLWFEYRKSLFDRNFINQAMKHIEMIILQLLEFPHRKISEFEILSEIDKSKILKQSQKEVNKQIIENNHTIVSLFENQVKLSNANIAIIDDSRTYTYRELNQQANQLARQILERTGNEVGAVAVSLERGYMLIVTLLAILKAGCFYVPIPLNYPLKRKAHIVDEVEAKLWVFDSVTNNNKSTIEPISSSVELFDLSIELEPCKLKNIYSDDFLSEISPDSKAYIIYTSGSSGKPKGVKLNHRNVVVRLIWLKEYFSLNNNDRVLQNTDFSFDVSVAEIFWPLISGAILIPSEQNKSMDQKYLLDVVEQNRVTCCCLVPSLLRVLITHDKESQLGSVQQFLVAGEVLSEPLAKLFYSNCSTKKAKLYNFYGPTEAAIYASFEKIDKNKLSNITIGKALGNTSLYVVGENDELLPEGVVGELYIGGDGVAAGYHKNQVLTKKHFFKNPFSSLTNLNSKVEPHLYATGDLVRLQGNGKLEFMGRIDRQVKVRGYRVELGEIESRIIEYPSILDVTVIQYKKQESQFQIVAYLVKRLNLNSGVLDSDILSSLKDELLKNIPHYMIPSIFIFTDSIPKLPSGKVNIQLLPNPQSYFSSNAVYRAAESSLEKSLVKIWSNLLSIDIEKISMNTSFFDLGGDSLMAIQFVSLAEKERLYFEMSDLFEMRCIAQLAKVVKKDKKISNSQELVSGYYPLLPRQAKFFDDEFINPHYWNRTFSFTVNHDLNVEAFYYAIDSILKTHDNLRVKFELLSDGTWQQNCVLPEELVSTRNKIFNQFDLSRLNSNEQRIKIVDIINQHHQQINLSEAPLIRIVHFSTSKRSGQLTIVFHHLLLDMVSARLIFEDLISAYQEKNNNLPLQLFRKTTSVKKWALHLLDRINNHDFSKSIDYWKILPKYPAPILPVDFQLTPSEKIKANIEANAQLKMFTLSKSYTEKLLIDVQNIIDMPIQNFLLACVFDIMCCWTNCRTMTISTCGHGRNIEDKQYDLSKTVGWLNTVYPVYLMLPEKHSIFSMQSIEFFQLVQKQLAKVPVDNIDYNLLRHSAKLPAMLNHASPELFFNYVGQIDSIIPKGVPFTPCLDLPGLAGIDSRNHLCYQLYFECGVIGEQLTFRLTYSNELYKSKTIDLLTDLIINRIEHRVNEITNC